MYRVREEISRFRRVDVHWATRNRGEKKATRDKKNWLISEKNRDIDVAFYNLKIVGRVQRKQTSGVW